MIDFFYYPCAGIDGSVVRLMGRVIPHFLYSDDQYSFDELNKDLFGPSAEPGLLEAWTREGRPPPPNSPSHDFSPFLHHSPGEITSLRERTPLAKLSGFLTEVRFPLRPDRTSAHGLPQFTLTFVKGDGIAVFKELLKRKLYPTGVACIRPGISFGGNRGTYADELAGVLRRLLPPPTYYIRDDQDYDRDLPRWENDNYEARETHRANTTMEENCLLTLCTRFQLATASVCSEPSSKRD